jgi:hypothetical protein
MAFNKTVCGVTRGEFEKNAEPVTVIFGTDDNDLELEVKQFKSGSFGWYYGGKVRLRVGGKTVVCQVGINCTVVGSKTLPQDSEEDVEESDENVA